MRIVIVATVLALGLAGCPAKVNNNNDSAVCAADDPSCIPCTLDAACPNAGVCTDGICSSEGNAELRAEMEMQRVPIYFGHVIASAHRAPSARECPAVTERYVDVPDLMIVPAVLVAEREEDARSSSHVELYAVPARSIFIRRDAWTHFRSR